MLSLLTKFIVFIYRFIGFFYLVSNIVSIQSLLELQDISIRVRCKNFDHGTGNQYTCLANNIYVDGPNYVVGRSIATHLPGKNQYDVQGVYMEDQFVQYLPAQIESIYPNMTSMQVINSRLQFIKQSNFCKNLRSLNLDKNLIQDVPKNSFSETIDLEWISMDNNRIEELFVGVFDKMPKLRVASFSGNRLRRLRGTLFALNVNIERLNFNGNQLSTIDADLVQGLAKLRIANFDSNICIDKAFYSELEIIEKLTKHFKNFCFCECAY